MTDKTLAARLQSALGLALAPIAVTLTDERPDAVPGVTEPAAAGCVFWERAARGAVVTEARDHEHCAIGVYTHNLAGASPDYAGELGSVLGVLDQLGYASPEDVARIPVMARQARYVVYAPLADAPIEPDLVLVFANARQGLVVTEAVQQVEPDAPPALGRPACAIVPQAINTGRAALSLGCCGARAYVDALDEGTALWALPGANLARYVERIEVLASANTTLTRFHQLRAEDVGAGSAPTYADSMARLAR